MFQNYCCNDENAMLISCLKTKFLVIIKSILKIQTVIVINWVVCSVSNAQFVTKDLFQKKLL